MEEVLVRHPQRLVDAVAAVDLRRIVLERSMPGAEVGEFRGPAVLVVASRVIDCRPELLANSVGALVLPMKVEREIAQTDPAQPLLDDVECSLLLGDEQYRLADVEGVRDQVRDRLGLAGAGGPSRTKVRPCAAAATARNCEPSAGIGTGTVVSSTTMSSRPRSPTASGSHERLPA
ncbi:hypothetical protein GS575_27945 [Rhodococcus hoagii]|nr:hypothetical protein [Prescottella equi]